MTITTTTRPASIDEIAAEMDRRGEVIERLERERDEAREKGFDEGQTFAWKTASGLIQTHRDMQEKATARAEKAEARVAELEAGLKFYGQRQNYVARSGMEFPISKDGFGGRARVLLKEHSDV